MSNELAVLGNQLPADVREQLAADVMEDLSRLGGVGGKDMIRITQDKKFVFPDETTSAGPLELVIVDFVYRNEYYPNPYKAKEITPPSCFAVNEHQAALIPTPRSPKMQVEAGKLCKDCQWDVFGSSPTGSGKACKNTIYMAVLPPDADEKTPLWVIRTSPTAIQPFNAYVSKVMKIAKVPSYSVVTKVFFDPNISYASLRFDVVGVNPILTLTQARREEARGRLLQEPDFSGAEE